ETWTHADDVRRAVGLAEQAPPAPTLHLLCRAAVGLVPLMLQARGVEPPDRRLRMRLTGAGAADWDVTLADGAVTPAGAEPADVTVRLDTVALCRAVSARLPADGLRYEAEGDVALARQ